MSIEDSHQEFITEIIGLLLNYDPYERLTLIENSVYKDYLLSPDYAELDIYSEKDSDKKESDEKDNDEKESDEEDSDEEDSDEEDSDEEDSDEEDYVKQEDNNTSVKRQKTCLSES